MRNQILQTHLSVFAFYVAAIGSVCRCLLLSSRGMKTTKTERKNKREKKTRNVIREWERVRKRNEKNPTEKNENNKTDRHFSRRCNFFCAFFNLKALFLISFLINLFSHFLSFETYTLIATLLTPYTKIRELSDSDKTIEFQVFEMSRLSQCHCERNEREKINANVLANGNKCSPQNIHRFNINSRINRVWAVKEKIGS